MSLSQAYTNPPQTEKRSIPPELRQLEQWVNRDAGKRPINARTGQLASPTDAATWCDHDTAAVASPLLGFVLTEHDPYFLIDLDKCRDPETGEIEAWAFAIVDRFATYTEVSLSGTGLHLIGRGELPKAGNRKGGIEVYTAGRYVAITGDVLPGYERIRSCQRTLTEWHHEVWPIDAPKTEASPAPRSAPIIHLEDRDLIERLRRQQDGGKASRLLDGDDGDHPSPSEARSALGAYCCFWNADVDQVERVIRDHGPWSDEDWKDAAERDRKARIDAEHVVAWYERNGGKRYSGPPPAADYEHVDTDTGEILDTETDLTSGVAESEAVERWRRRALRAERDRDQLAALILHPTLKHAEKIAAVRSGQLALKKRPDDAGRVAIKPAEISNDWRPKPEKGENTPLTNADGSIPLMNRGSVAGVMKRLSGNAPLGCKKTARLISAEGVAQRVQPKNGGQPWSETVWYIERPASLGDFIAPAVEFSAERKRKLRTITPPCPECGEVHPRTVQTETHYTCHGCGSEWSETSKPHVEQPIIQIGPDETGPAPGGWQDTPAAAYRASPPPPSDDAEDPDDGDGVRHCISCDVTLATSERHLCADCAEAFRRREHQQRLEHRKRRGVCIDGDCPEPAVAGSFYCARHGGRSEVSA